MLRFEPPMKMMRGDGVFCNKESFCKLAKRKDFETRGVGGSPRPTNTKARQGSRNQNNFRRKGVICSSELKIKERSAFAGKSPKYKGREN